MIVNPDNGLVYGVASRNYNLVSHEESVGRMLDVCKTSPFGEPDVDVNFFQGGRKMEAKFTFPWTKNIDRKVGDIVNPTATIRNSYDFVWMWNLIFGATNLRCLNGMVSWREFFHYEKKHTLSLDPEAIRTITMQGLSNFGDQVEVWKHWTTRITQVDEYEKIMNKLDFGQRDTEALENTVEVSSGVMLDDIKVRTLTYWAFWCIVTQFITHQVGSGLKRVLLNTQASRAFY
jgi:hypothetical protein